jgi:hypothetical protein
MTLEAAPVALSPTNPRQERTVATSGNGRRGRVLACVKLNNRSEGGGLSKIAKSAGECIHDQNNEPTRRIDATSHNRLIKRESLTG